MGKEWERSDGVNVREWKWKAVQPSVEAENLLRQPADINLCHVHTNAVIYLKGTALLPFSGSHRMPYCHATQMHNASTSSVMGFNARHNTEIAIMSSV